MEPLVIENKIKTFVYSTPKARANVVVAHGMMEHPGRYLDFIKTLNDQNFNVITFNQLGCNSKFGALGKRNVSRIG